MLGCETSGFQGTAGFLGKVNSLRVTDQLRTAFTKENWLEFFNSVGSPDHPFVFPDFLDASVVDMKIIQSKKMVTPGSEPELRVARIVFSMPKESLNLSASPQASRDQTPESIPTLKGTRTANLVLGSVILIIGAIFFVFTRNWFGRS